jgi:hypothetical protein
MSNKCLDREKAQSYLKEMQKNIYKYINGRNPGDFHKKMREAESLKNELQNMFTQLGGVNKNQNFNEFFNFMSKRFDDNVKDCPSLYEQPLWFGLLTTFTQEIDEILQERSSFLPQNYLFGTLPTGMVNGIALKVPDCSYTLLLFEDGLFGFANLMSKAVAHAFQFQKNVDDKVELSVSADEIENKISSNPDLTFRFFDALASYLVKGDPHFAEQYYPDSNYEPVVSCLRNSMEIFVLGHEYGHLICNHLSSKLKKTICIGDIEASIIPTAWEQEFEADVKGLEIMLAVMAKRGFDLPLSFWGADLFFSCIDIVEKGIHILSTGHTAPSDVLSKTHPPTSLRRERLREVMQNSLDNEVSSSAIYLADNTKKVIDIYWTRTEKILLEMYSDGIQLAPVWQQRTLFF